MQTVIYRARPSFQSDSMRSMLRCVCLRLWMRPFIHLARESCTKWVDVVLCCAVCFFGQNNIRPHQPLIDLGRHTRQAAALALMIHQSAFVSVSYMSSLV